MFYIQSVQPEEAATVAKLAHSIWHEYYTPIIGQSQVTYMLQHFQSEEQIRRDLAGGYEYLLICDESGTYAGYASIRPDADELFISKLYISAPYRGKKAGSQLLQHLFTLAHKYNKSSVWLTVNKNNANSIAFYQAWGFTIFDSVLNDIGSGFFMDDYIMKKPL